jgi:NADH dehydrogenase FAD-containing subunit
VELAGEILTQYPDKEVTIVDFQSKICAPFPDASIDYMTKWLEKKGCKLVLGTPIGGKFPDLLIDDKGCTLADGRRFDADIVYKCMGFHANAPFMKPHFESCVDRAGRLVVDDYLRLEKHEKVFAMGDCMIHDKSGEIKLGHTAEVNAHLVVENIHRLEQGRAPVGYPEGVTGKGPTPKIYNISLGKYDASLGFNSLVMNGKLAAFSKWLLEWTKVWAAAEQPIGVLFWKVADGASMFIGKYILPPKAKL